MDAVVRLTYGLLLLTAVFWAIERLFGLPGVAEAPGDPAARRVLGVRRDTWTDIIYWFITPIVTRTITFAGVVLAVVVLAAASGVTVGGGDGVDALVAGSVVGTQPRWVQAIEVIVVLDFMGYWFHRAFHRGRLWRFHAVHHSPRRVTWLSSVRLHPVNDLVPRVAQVMLLLTLGFDPAVLAGAVPALAFYTLLLHARVPWRFGPLRFVLASPAFHRWHHAAQADGRGRNFAGFLPIWDLLFGTYYVPRDAQPRQFGAPGEAVPEGFWAQMVWPFRRHRAAETAGMLARDVPPPPAQ
jgi:sterol desaturase/sphingolipid hydroxylase (fatty acid hydroxylase superfamily)